MATSPVPSTPSTPSTAEETEGRNLVLSIDGTANEFSIQNTNVVELCRILIKDETQLTYYTSGIGTFADPHNTIFGKVKQSLNTALEMITARHFERKVFAAYQWLSENYRPGDKIFLFGFSRGAYFVRIIAGMIARVGLLHKGNTDQIPFAFKLYAQSQAKHVHNHSSSDTDSKDSTLNERVEDEDEPVVDPDILCLRYKEAFSHSDVKVHFLGAWDTVSSIRLTRKPCLPDTIDMSHVAYFRHALALDEWRVKFVPEYTHRCDLKRTEKVTSGEPAIKEVWFRGFHADVGGGNNTKRRQNRPSLHWMVAEASNCGLKFREYPQKGDLPSTHEDPATWYWNVIEWFPIRRVTHGSGTNSCQEFTRKWHRGRPRTIRDSHYIHSSVKDAMTKDGYKPKARLCEGQ